jgi:hypothetical protein
MLILLPNAVSYGMLIEPEGDASGLETALSRAKIPGARPEFFA